MLVTVRGWRGSRVGMGMRLHRLRRNVGPEGRWRSLSTAAAAAATTGSASPLPSFLFDDEMISALNGAQDISIRLVSCKRTLQTILDRRGDRLPDALAQPLGELLAGTTLLASSLKGDEALQVQIVSPTGLVKSLLAICDANLHTRARVVLSSANPSVQSIDTDDSMETKSPLMAFVGEGQLQVIKTHPHWKMPATGVTAIDPRHSIATNLAMYLAQSEQRVAAMICEVLVQEGCVKHCLALLVERMPDATDAHVEQAIANVEAIQRKTMKSYFSDVAKSNLQSTKVLTMDTAAATDCSTASVTGLLTTDQQALQALADSESLHRIVDDCLSMTSVGEREESKSSTATRPKSELSSDGGGLRYAKSVHFQCQCSMERVLGALKVLPRKELQEMIETQQPIHMQCEFCGTNYSPSMEEVGTLLTPVSSK